MTDSGPNWPIAMEYGRLPGVDKRISRIVMGTVASEDLGRAWAHEMLDAYAALGGNAIDTARHYGDTAEGAIGSWLRSRSRREEFVLIGKAGHPEGGRNRVNPADIAGDLTRSLELLETDYLDVLLLHRDDPSVPAGEIVEWLNEHVRAGRARVIGGSNWRHERLEEANGYAAPRDLVPLVVSSPNLSLGLPNEPLWPGCLTLTVEDREWYARSRMPVLAWSAQAQGFFSGTYRREDRTDANAVRIWYNDTNFERLERVKQAAGRHRVPMTAVALAWVLHQPFPTFAVIGPRSLSELGESSQALRLALTQSEVESLEQQKR